MSRIKKILLGFLFVFIAIQFVHPAHNRSSNELPTDFANVFVVPATVQSTLQTACYDCHSNNTDYPWYSSIQPIAWMMAWHINNGKAQLNFSSFGSNSKRKQISKLKEIINQVRDDEMPLTSYKIMHSKANLSAQQKILLTAWLTAAADSLQNK
ncbi:MAG: cytochrome [Ferruginibacter sp.]|nr:cytochrome [Ferruginibacter sp.]